MEETKIEVAEQLLHHQFREPALLREALTHASAASDRLASNERMEFLGDAVLDLIVCDALYSRFPDLHEGDLTTMKSSVVSRRTCAAIARDSGLDQLLVVGKGIANRQSLPSSLAAGVYESVVAALYLDGGLAAAKAFVLRTMEPFIKAAGESEHANNFKAMLQQHVQIKFNTGPTYQLLDEQGPDHSKCFHVGVTIDGEPYGSAWGPNKKQAEQKAAVQALWTLDLLGDDEREEALGAIDESQDSLV